MPSEKDAQIAQSEEVNGRPRLRRFFSQPHRTPSASASVYKPQFPQSIQRTVSQAIFTDLSELNSPPSSATASRAEANGYHRFIRTCDLDIGGIIHYTIPSASLPLSLETAFGDPSDPVGKPGMLASELFEAVKVEVAFVPTFSCTSFVMGQVMNGVTRGERFRPYKKPDGFSVECSPLTENTRIISEHQCSELLPGVVEDAFKPNLTMEVDTRLPHPEASFLSPLVPSPSETSKSSEIDDLCVSFISSSSEPMFNAESILCSSSLPSLVSKTSMHSSDGEIDLGNTSISSLDSGNMSIGPITPPRLSTSSYQMFGSFDDDLGFTAMHSSPIKEEPLAAPRFLQYLQPRSALTSLNTDRRSMSSISGKGKKKKGTNMRRRHPGKENIDPNIGVTY